MQGITFYESKKGMLPKFIDHTESAVMQSIEDLFDMIEEEISLSSDVMCKRLTSYDLARILGFVVQTQIYPKHIEVEVAEFEMLN
jgi:hypothetical protein